MIGLLLQVLGCVFLVILLFMYVGYFFHRIGEMEKRVANLEKQFSIIVETFVKIIQEKPSTSLSVVKGDKP